MYGLVMVYVSMVICFIGNLIAIKLLVNEIQELKETIRKGRR